MLSVRNEILQKVEDVVTLCESFPRMPEVNVPWDWPAVPL